MAQCKATANRTGRQCQKRAVAGAAVCLSHGAGAKQVRRVAAQRVALARAAELLGPDVQADPAEVLVAAVRSSAALLGAHEAAVTADEPDPDALRQLADSALLAGRLAKLALDAGLEARLTRQAEQAGQAVASMVTAVVNGLELPPAVSAAAFRLVRREVEKQPSGLELGRYAGMSVAELDVEIAQVVAELDAVDAKDAIDGFPARMAGTLQAALEVLELTDDQREQAIAAAEKHLAGLAGERAERDRLRMEKATAILGDAPWWVNGRHRGYANGNGRP
jgi:hypothetical protein